MTRSAAGGIRAGSVEHVRSQHLLQQAETTSHHTSTVERGAFAVARCTCGWSGPARRARDRARQDADGHRTGR